MKNLISLFLALLAGCCGASALPEGEWAVINASCVFMRGEASYTSENVSQSRMGTPVQVLERSGYWVRVRTPEPYEGWVNELTLSPMPEGYGSLPRYIYVAEYGHVYAEPSFRAARLCDLRMSDILRAGRFPVADGKDGSWTEVQLWDGRTGWVPAAEVADFGRWMADAAYRAAIRSDSAAGCYVDLQKTPKTQVAPASDVGLPAFSAKNASSPGPSGEVVSTARLFLGAPYMWGGMSAGLFDCSGLVGFCCFMAGIQLPRDASQQIKCGEPVEFEQMQAGDLVFFGEKRVSHVALCTGPGRIIHSSQIVRENSLIAGEPDYYGRNILGIRRIIGHLPEKDLVKNSPLYFSR